MSRLSILHNSTQIWGLTLDLLGAGSISGSSVTGATLTCNPPTYSSNGSPVSPSFTYQWKADGVDISGATASTYVSLVVDETKVISCDTTATYQSKTDVQNILGPTIVAGGAMPAKPSANLSTAGAVTVTSGAALQGQINANPDGTVFYFPNGTYTGVYNVRPKQGNRFIGQSEAGVILQGNSSNRIAFRTRQNNITWARMTLQGYGNADRDQNVGIIDLHDGSSPANASTYVNWWPKFNKAEDCHIDQITIQDCGDVGIYTGIRTNITDCSFYRLNPQGIGGGGGFGGMIHSCYFEECGEFGAPGAGANKAAIKIVNHNAGPWGDSARDMTPHFSRRGGVQPSDSPVETLQIVNSTFEGNNITDIARGIWFDIDVRDTEVSYCTFQNINGAGIFYEGCNNGWVHHNDYTNVGNIGAINFSGGFNTSYNHKYMSYAAVTAAASHNVLVEDNTFTDCEVGLLFFNGARYETPSDWLVEYPVITWGEMSAGYGPLGPTDRSNGGASTCTAQNNIFQGATNHIGFWCIPDVNEPGAHNESTFTFTGNTYPAGANSFVFNRTFQTQAQWNGAGRS